MASSGFTMPRTRLAIFMRRALDHSSIFLFTLYPLRSRTYLEFKEDIIEDYSKDCRDSFNRVLGFNFSCFYL